MTFDTSHRSRTALETIEIAISFQSPSLTLEVQDPEGARRVTLIQDKTLTVGSGRGADIRVNDRTVSSKHCEVTAYPGGLMVKDLSSRNGTFAGGARIEQGWCHAGTTILIGQTSIVCEPPLEDDDEELGAPLPGVAGASRPMRRVASTVRRFAKLRAPVLIAGETGVGKELIARALHAEGPREKMPFIALNASTLPRDLVESELFGHERGAFTGAVNRRAGAFEAADGGTLFLDEIGELPLDAQPKLLRALDGYEVRSVGAAGSGRRVDARVVAATHVPLAERVSRGAFRRDLFHRLEVLVVELPPLRERLGDVLPISRAFLESMREEYGERRLTPAAVAALTAYSWPGNVRELQNVLTRAAELASRTRPWIDVDVMHRAVRRSARMASSTSGSSASAPPGVRRPASSVTLTSEEARSLLATFEGNTSAAARAAGLPRTTFRKVLARRDRKGRPPSFPSDSDDL